MLKCFAFILLAVVNFYAIAQETILPADFRQHNLTEFNSSLLSPIFSLDRNNPQSVALWTRWQWQTVDGDPTTIFFNYTRRLNLESAAGAGFFQHNTGAFIETGGVLNYAYSLALNADSQLAFGINLFGFQRRVANSGFQPNPDIILPQFDVPNEFVLQIAPSIRYSYDAFSAALVAENFLDYNFENSAKDTEGSEKVYIGLLSYNFPVTMFGSSESTFIRPTLYLKTLPIIEDQIGLTTLLSTPKFWAQLGYNSFYGISAGVGGRFFENFSIGALLEFGSEGSVQGRDTSFEFVTAYNFGPGDLRKRVVGFEEEEEEVLVETKVAETEKEEVAQQQQTEKAAIEKESTAREEAEIAEREATERSRDSLLAVQKEMALANAARREQEVKDSIADAKKAAALVIAQRKAAEKKADSIARIQEKEAALLAQQQQKQRRADSLAAVKKEEALLAERRKETRKRQDSLAKVELALIEAARKKAVEEEAMLAAKRREAQKRQDSLEQAELAAIETARKKAAQEEALLAAQRVEDQKRQDSIAQAALAEKEAASIAAQEEEVTPQPGEKYEEVATEDGLLPGYYLIANVFGTKKYYDGFMKTLAEKGLEPKSFYRSYNKYNYVYLQRYNTMDEARRARDGKFNGRYPDKTWIYRVTSN